MRSNNTRSNNGNYYDDNSSDDREIIGGNVIPQYTYHSGLPDRPTEADLHRALDELQFDFDQTFLVPNGGRINHDEYSDESSDDSDEYSSSSSCVEYTEEQMMEIDRRLFELRRVPLDTGDSLSYLDNQVPMESRELSSSDEEDIMEPFDDSSTDLLMNNVPLNESNSIDTSPQPINSKSLAIKDLLSQLKDDIPNDECLRKLHSYPQLELTYDKHFYDRMNQVEYKSTSFQRTWRLKICINEEVFEEKYNTLSEMYDARSYELYE